MIDGNINLENITREEAIREHRKMWNWIATETLKRKKVVTKEDYIKFIGLENRFELETNNCFCCLYDFQQRLKISKKDHYFGTPRCKFCPLDWNTSFGRIMCGYKYNDDGKIDSSNNLFYEWEDCLESGDWEKSAKIAKKISNLKERKIIL